LRKMKTQHSTEHMVYFRNKEVFFFFFFFFGETIYQQI